MAVETGAGYFLALARGRASGPPSSETAVRGFGGLRPLLLRGSLAFLSSPLDMDDTCLDDLVVSEAAPGITINTGSVGLLSEDALFPFLSPSFHDDRLLGFLSLTAVPKDISH